MPFQGPETIRDMLMEAQSLSEDSAICLLAHPNLSSPNLPLFLTLHRWMHQMHPSLLYLYLHYLIHCHHCSLRSPFPHHHHLLLLLLPLLMQHHLHPAPLQAGCPPLLLTSSLCLIMTLSQNMSLIPFLCLWQILILTMNLLWICDLPHLPHLLMVSPQGDSQGDDLGDDLGNEQGGSQGGKVRHNPACLLH